VAAAVDRDVEKNEPPFARQLEATRFGLFHVVGLLRDARPRDRLPAARVGGEFGEPGAEAESHFDEWLETLRRWKQVEGQHG
jgi:hypothetical protein